MRSVVAFFFLLQLLVPGFAQQGTPLKCEVNPADSPGTVWIGGCRGDLRHGRGVMFYETLEPGQRSRYAMLTVWNNGIAVEPPEHLYVNHEVGGLAKHTVNSKGEDDAVEVKPEQVPSWAKFVLRNYGTPVSDTDLAAARTAIGNPEARVLGLSGSQARNTGRGAAASGSASAASSSTEPSIKGGAETRESSQGGTQSASASGGQSGGGGRSAGTSGVSEIRIKNPHNNGYFSCLATETCMGKVRPLAKRVQESREYVQRMCSGGMPESACTRAKGELAVQEECESQCAAVRCIRTTRDLQTGEELCTRAVFP